MEGGNLSRKSELLDLPNEVLIQILDRFSLKLLTPLLLVCTRFHDLVLRILLARCTLPKLPKDHVIIFECYHPSARSFEPHLLCQYLGTPGLQITATPGSISTDSNSDEKRSEYGKLAGLYSHFRPMRRKACGPSLVTGLTDAKLPNYQEDLPNSGDPECSMESASFMEPLASQPINLDAEEPFSQLCLNMCLVKLGPRPGISFNGPTVYFEGLVTLAEGHQRLKRKWLDETSKLSSGQESWDAGVLKTSCEDTSRWYGDDDLQMLWCDAHKNTGIHVALRERAWRRAAPVLMRQEEPAVSYVMDHQELLIRTVHLVRAIEEAKLQMNGPSGKAMIIGTVRR